MSYKYFPLLLMPFLFQPAMSSCHAKNKDTGAITNSFSDAYDLSRPVKKWVLPASLVEISGITWLSPNKLLAIEDMHANLYELQLDKALIIEKTIPFKTSGNKKFDIEDVALVNNTVYALWSHGTVFKISNWNNTPSVQEFDTPFSKENNTEGLCYNPVTKNLLIACKNESEVEDEKRSTRSIFEYDVTTNKVKDNPFLLIHKKDFKKFTGDDVPFYPSAVAVHPITHDVYVLSTKDTKCMAVYGYSGGLKSFQVMQKNLLPQPEGLCFAPDGTLYISTEGKHGDPGILYQYAYKK